MNTRVVLIFGVSLFCAIAIFFLGVVYADQSIRLIVNGRDIYCDVPPFIKNGRTFVPVRSMVEALNIPIKWDSDNRSVIVGIPEEGTDLASDLLPYTGIDSMIRTHVTVGGVKYNKGFLMGPTDNYPRNFENELRWNLGGKYDKVEFYCQYTDDSYQYSTKDNFEVYIDGIKVKTEAVDRNVGLIKFSYDVKNKNTFYFKINHFVYNKSWIAIINPRAVKY